VLAAFVWGLAEATFFFVIPDVFLSFVALLDWPRTSKHILAAIAGALLGGALLFHWASADLPQPVLPWFMFPSSPKIYLRR